MFLYIYCLPIGQSVLYLIGAAAIWILVSLCIQYIGGKREMRLLCGIALLIWIAVVLSKTVFSRTVDVYEIHLLPFYQIYSVLNGGNPELIRTAWMNMLLFVPCGMLMPEILEKYMEKRELFWRTMVFALCVSACIELAQGICSLGLMETDDVMCNTFGAGIGYGIYLLKCILKRRRRE